MARVIIAFNATTAQLSADTTPSVMDSVSQVLSYEVAGAEHTRAFASGHWSGRSSFFSRRNRTFPAGFVHLVHSKLVADGHDVHLARRPLPAPLGTSVNRDDEDPRYDYQAEAVERLVRHGRGIAQIATGGGKSRIARLAIERIARPTLFLTTRGSLMYQMADNLLENGHEPGIVGDSEWKPSSKITCGMVQTLEQHLREPDIVAERMALLEKNAKAPKASQLKHEQIQKLAKQQFDRKVRIRERAIKFLAGIEFLIGEEAHEAGGASYYSIAQHCKNAHYRLALTATPFMKDDMEDNYQLMAAFGPRLIVVSEKTLIDRGILATPYFKFADVAPGRRVFRTSPWRLAYPHGVVKAEPRNASVVYHAKRAADLGLPVMILVQRTEHGNILKKALQKSGIAVSFIRGENDQTGRKRALKALGAGRIQVLIGTTILDVGIDVPAVGLVINAGGGKAEVNFRQRIGRGLRAKKHGPNCCFFLDFDDGLNQTLQMHAKTRRAIINATPGFAERVVEEFPWEIFEKSAAA